MILRSRPNETPLLHDDKLIISQKPRDINHLRASRSKPRRPFPRVLPRNAQGHPRCGEGG